MSVFQHMRWMRSILALSTAIIALVMLQQLSRRDATVTARGPSPLVAADLIDPERVSEITLERDGVVHRFVKRTDGWWQVEPLEFPADGWAVQQFLVRALKVESVRREMLPEDAREREEALKRAGLLPPAATLSLKERVDPISDADTAAEHSTSQGDRVLTISLGRRSLAGRAFARIASLSDVNEAQNFHVIDATLHEFALDRDLREFRRRDLFPGVDNIMAVRLLSGGGETAIARTGNTYKIESPIRARADRARCEEFFDVVRRAKSGGFIMDRPTDATLYGLSPATATIEVTREDGTTQSLRIGEVVSLGAQDRFGALGWSTAVVRLPAETLAAIVPRIDRLVDAVAAGVRPRDVGAIDITLRDTRLALRREVSGWSARVEPIIAPSDPSHAETSQQQTGTVDSSAVDRLLAGLCETRAVAIEIAPYPSQDGVALITLRGFGQEVLDTVRLARRASDGRTILENGDGVLRLQGDSRGDIDLPVDPASLGFRSSGVQR
ncbi:MAG: DUF4340 domain-containing protein [Limnohabitans sp.]|jgi:hypothetical protein|nr:DUF4340 domain-containing protein [Limnohabitans sp.]